MPYPPQLPPSNRTDATLSAIQHAGDHNATAQALAAIVDVLGPNPSGIYADLGTYLDKINSGVVRAADGHNYRMVAGPLRNDGAASSYWQPITAAHAPQFFDSVTTDDTYITVNYPSADGVTVVTLLVGADETLTAQGIIAGASVGPTQARIALSQEFPVYADYISWDGSAWQSATGKYAAAAGGSMVFTGGVLTLTHAPLPAHAPLDVVLNVSAVGRGVLDPFVGPGGATAGSIKLQFKDKTGTIITAPTTDMRVFVRHGGGRLPVNPKDITTALYPSSNLFLIGIIRTD